MGKVIKFDIEKLLSTKFSRLLLIKDLGYIKQPYVRYGLYQCDCGNQKEIKISSVVLGRSKSCGCLTVIATTKRNTTHGLTNSPEFKTWMKMKERCYSPSCEEYKHYGGRGIFMDEKWKNDFATFLKDMGKRPYKMSIERIDNSLGYFKENCKWATHKEQSNNRRSNVNVEYKGQTKTIKQWTEDLNLNYNLTRVRIVKLGWSVEKSFTEPCNTNKRPKNVG